jgi:DNA-binding LacI/PurR family transcriptional regulator
MKKLSSPVSRPRRVTLKDVAAHVGVGYPTVSTVLSNSENGKYVSDDTRQRILQAAEALGYQPNQSARTIKTGRFGSVALLSRTNKNRYGLPEPLLESLHDELALRSQHIMLVRLPDTSLTDESVLPRILREWTVDGLVVEMMMDAPPKMIELIRRHHIPAVWVNSDQHIDCVRPEDEGGGYLAARYFMDLGHTRIAYVAQPGSHYSIVHRERGYLRAMREAGLQPQVLTLDWWHEDAQGRYKTVHSWLSTPDRPTAFIFYSTETAEMVYYAAGVSGLRVPDDFSMLGISEKPRRCINIDLDTLIVPFREVGALAVQQLMAKIDNPYASFPLCDVPFKTISQGTEQSNPCVTKSVTTVFSCIP